MVYKIACRELTGEECDFSVEGESKGEAKKKFYAHGAGSPIHKEKYHSATEEEAASFGKKVDEHLASQDVEE